MDPSADSYTLPDPIWHDIMMHLAGIGHLGASHTLSRASAELTAGFRQGYSVGLFPESIIGCKLSGTRESIMMRPLYVKRNVLDEHGIVQCIVDAYVVLGRSKESILSAQPLYPTTQYSLDPVVRVIKLVSSWDITTDVLNFKNTTAAYIDPNDVPKINCGKIDMIFDVTAINNTYHTCVVTRQSIVSDYLRQDKLEDTQSRANCLDDIFIMPISSGQSHIDDIMSIMRRRSCFIPTNGTYYSTCPKQDDLLYAEITSSLAKMSMGDYPSAETCEFVARVKTMIRGILAR